MKHADTKALGKRFSWCADGGRWRAARMKMFFRAPPVTQKQMTEKDETYRCGGKR